MSAGLEGPVLKRITIAAGLIAAAIGVIGLVGLASGITALTSVLPGYKSIAVSAALIWIFLGLVLVLHARRPHTGKLVLAVQVVLAGIVIIEAIELPLSLMGSHSFIEIFSVRIGSALLGTPTTPISPAASALIIPAAIALLLLISPGANKKRNRQIRGAGGITGLVISLAAFTFVLSYVYEAPFLYNTVLIPMALTSALAGFFIGVGIVAAAGKAAIPLKYFTGSSTQARLLRVFVPLVIILTVVQDIIFIIIADMVQVQDALILSVCIVIFSILTAWVIARFSGRIGRDLELAEDALKQKNEDLGAMNEELTAITEELRQNNDELIRNEKALRESQQRNTFLADILDKSAQPFGVGYHDGKMGIVNKAFVDLTGYSAEELRGVDWVGVLTPPEWHDVERHHLAELHRSGKPVWYEKEYIRKDGTRIPIELLVHLVANEDGSPQYYYSFITDITERKRAEKELLRRNEDLNAANEEITATQEELQQSNNELLESEQELRKTSQYLENLINYANAPIVVWNPNFVITRFNHAFEELTGRTAREIIGQRLEVLFPPRYLDASMEIIRKTMYGERLKVVEIPILNRRGEIRIALWNSATLFEADGSTIHSTIAQGNDITERKIAEAELEEKNEELNGAIEELTRQGYELNEALKEKEVLLSEVHHRVKNNLTAFISLLSLESTYDDSPSGLALKKDLQNRARSMALIHETLYRTKKYSRVDMDVYLSTLVGQIVSSYESAKSVKTVVDAHGITLDLSRATPGGLIINELLTNSLKYAFPMSFDCEMIRGAPCMIEVRLTEDDRAYLLTVRDNGIGLPEDLDIATTKTLGLKLVNFLAKHQLRASIEVHSDKGSEFRFRFRDKV